MSPAPALADQGPGSVLFQHNSGYEPAKDIISRNRAVPAKLVVLGGIERPPDPVMFRTIRHRPDLVLAEERFTSLCPL
jgi:hypothetical protein